MVQTLPSRRSPPRFIGKQPTGWAWCCWRQRPPPCCCCSEGGVPENTTARNHCSLIVIGLLFYVVIFQHMVYQQQITDLQHQQQQQHHAPNASASYAKTMTLMERLMLEQQQQQKQQQMQPQQQEVGQPCPAITTTTTTTTTNSAFTNSSRERRPLRLFYPVQPVRSDAQPWKTHSIEHSFVKIPYPAFVTSLPKTGTTSIWKYFLCGQQAASHQWVKLDGRREGGNKDRQVVSGACIHHNIRNDRPPFEDCGIYDIYADTGYTKYDHDKGEHCFFPNVDGLEAIYTSYPNATFIHLVRNVSSWYESVKLWANSGMFIRMKMCNATGFPHGQSDRDDWYDFYHWHNAMIRQFVRDRPSLTYIEIELESPNTASILEQRIGIPAQCWMNCRPDRDRCEQEIHADNERLKQRLAAEKAARLAQQQQEQEEAQEQMQQ